MESFNSDNVLSVSSDQASGQMLMIQNCSPSLESWNLRQCSVFTKADCIHVSFSWLPIASIFITSLFQSNENKASSKCISSIHVQVETSTVISKPNLDFIRLTEILSAHELFGSLQLSVYLKIRIFPRLH